MFDVILRLIVKFIQNQIIIVIVGKWKVWGVGRDRETARPEGSYSENKKSEKGSKKGSWGKGTQEKIVSNVFLQNGIFKVFKNVSAFDGSLLLAGGDLLKNFYFAFIETADLLFE